MGNKRIYKVNQMQENTEENYKGWTGSKRAVFVCNGAKGHAQEERAG